MLRTILLVSILLGAFAPSLLAQSDIEKSFYAGEYEQVIGLVRQQVNQGQAGTDDLVLGAQGASQLFDFSTAIQFWQMVLDVDSTHARAIEGIADGYNNLGNYRQALAYYCRILPADTVGVAFWGKFAGVLTNLEMDKQVVPIYEKLLQVDSLNLFLMRKLAAARYTLKDYNGAVDCLIKYRKLNPTDLTMGLALATSYQRMEKNNEAVLVLEELLLSDSTLLAPLNKLAYIHYNNLKNYEKAVVLYRKVNQMEGHTDPIHLINQGVCEYFVGNHAFSAKLLDSMAYVNASDPIVWFYAGMSYRKLGDIDQALSYLQTAAKFSIPIYAADMFHHLGRVYSLKRMFQEAITAYEKTREIDPGNSLVLYDLALAYEEMSRNSTMALAYYQQFTTETAVKGSAEYQYAVDRIKKIKEEQFFEGN